MAKGMFPFSGNFNVNKSAPLDARIVVDTKADLYKIDSWPSDAGNPYIYNGLIVSITDENALYMLIDNTKWDQEEGWKQVGSGSYDLGEFETFDAASDAAKAADICVNGEITRMSFKVSTIEDSVGFIDQFTYAGSGDDEYHYCVQILYWQGQVKRRQIKYAWVGNDPEINSASPWYMYMDAVATTTGPVLYSRDSEVVNLAGAQTITGAKTFNGSVSLAGTFIVGGKTFTFPSTAGALALNTPATQTANGLMASSDKTKLDNLSQAGTFAFGGVATLPQGTFIDRTKISVEDESTIKFATLPDGTKQFAVVETAQVNPIHVIITTTNVSQFTINNDSTTFPNGPKQIALTHTTGGPKWNNFFMPGTPMGFALFDPVNKVVYGNPQLLQGALPSPYYSLSFGNLYATSYIYFRYVQGQDATTCFKMKTSNGPIEAINQNEYSFIQAGTKCNPNFVVNATNITNSQYESEISTFINRTDNSLYAWNSDQNDLVQVSGAQEELVIGSGLTMGDKGLSINAGAGLGFDGNNNLYITANLDVDATYDTTLNDNLTTVKEVGGIPAGTTVDTLKGRTLISIFDDILFPTDNDVAVSNAVSVDYFAINPSAKTYCYIGSDYLGDLSSVMSAISNGGTFDKGSWDKYNTGKSVVGSEKGRKYELFYSDDSNVAGTTKIGVEQSTYTGFNTYFTASNINSGKDNLATYLIPNSNNYVKYLKPGRYTYKVTVSYNAGSAPVNNKNQAITGNTTINNAIKEGSVSSTKDVYVTKPWYATTANVTTLTEQTKVNWRESSNVTTEAITVVSQNGSNIPQANRQKIKIPRTLKKLETWDSVNKVYVDNTSLWTLMTGPDDYGYYTYCFGADGGQGAQQIKVTY